MMWSIARTELREVLRSKAFIAMSAIVAVLFIVAAITGWRLQSTLAVERHDLQNLVTRQWQAQPDRHPHRVAHYGSMAFRPNAPLAFFDFGVDSYTGNSIFLEAHKQNTANFSEARHATGMLRFGELTMACVLQTLVPLLIVFVCFAAWPREHERCTLSMLLSLGVRPATIMGGKILGNAVAVGAAVGPLLLLAVAFMVGSIEQAVGLDTLMRALLLAILYGLYVFGWVAAVVVLSSRHRRSAASLLGALCLWVFWVVLVPKGLPGLAERMHPSPSKPEFEAALHLDAAPGGDGHNPADPKFARVRQQLLDRYKVSKMEDLPINFKGVAMREGELQSSQAYQRHFTQLQETYRSQNRVLAWGSLCDPFLGARAVSMALAGTDYDDFVEFQRQAEKYRFDMIEHLNELQIHEIGWKSDKVERLSRQHWKEFPPFVYQPPQLAVVLRRLRLVPWSLILWAILVPLVGMHVRPLAVKE